MTKVFGKENMAAAIAMINSADEAEAMSKSIVGTNSAVEQAQTIMGSYNEKMARSKAWVDDLKIGFFNFIEGIAPAISSIFSVFNAMGQAAVTGNALHTAISSINVKATINTFKTWANTLAVKTNTITMLSASGVSYFFARSLKAVRTGFVRATLATRGFSLALLNIPVIGWIAAAVMAIVVAVKILWDNCRSFRELIFGIWQGAKAVFHNIGVVIQRLWSLVIKPIFSLWWNFYKTIFGKIWSVTKWVVTGIGQFFSWLWGDVIQPVGRWIWDFISGVFNGIWNIGKALWGWLLQIFSSFFGWINDTIVQPIYQAFGKVWDWLTSLFDRIMQRLKALIQPIVDLWNKLFSKEGITDVVVAYEQGKMQGGQHFDQNHQSPSDKPQEVKVVEDNQHKSIFDVSKGSTLSTPTIGGVAAEKTKTKKSGSSGNDSYGDSGNKVRNLTVGKMVENLNIYTQKGTISESKEQILQVIKELFATAVADFAGADRDATTA